MNRYPRRTDSKLNFEKMIQQANDVDRHNNLIFDPTVFSVMKDGTGMYVSFIPQPEVVEVPEDFGLKSIQGLTVTIYGGDITIGSNNYTVDDTSLILSGDAYVGWEYSFAGTSLSIVNFGSSVSQDDDHIRQKLYHFKYTAGIPDGSIAVDRDCHKSISFPANYGSY